MLDAVVATFLADPFKAILGSGGVVGVIVLGIKWLGGRARPRVRLLGHTYEPNGTYDCPVEIQVEIENVGREPTSVMPTVKMICRFPKKEKIRSTFQVREADRTLPPVAPRTFVLDGKPPVGFIFSHFRHYEFEFTRGGKVSLRVLNASGETVGPVKFWLLKWLFVLGGWLPHVPG